MSTYSDLRRDSFQGLETLATAFEGLVRNWKFSSELTGDVITPLQGSNWNGDAAESAAPAVTKARNELDAAFEEASAIAKALREAHTELAASRADLDAALKKAADHSLTVDANGVNVSWPAPASEVEKNDPSYEQTYRRLAQEVGVDISKAVARAEAADAAAATALGGATGTDRTAFRPSSGPEEQGKQAADLLKLAGNISDAQLDQLNKLLKDHANDPQFTTAFYNRLGPDGFLKYYGQLATVSTYKDGNKRPQAIADLQKNLGLALASATDSHNLPHLSDEWEAGLRKAGYARQDIWPPNTSPHNLNPFGYQILSNILRNGTYDSHFLNPIAEHVTQLSLGPGQWTSDRWSPDEFRYLKFLGLPAGAGEGGFNPMGGVLDALAHNPEASVKFFHGPTTLYNLDGTVKGFSWDNHYIKDLARPGEDSPLRDTWPGHDVMHDHAGKSTVLSFGNALEAGVTGRPFGSQDQLAPHTGEQAAMMQTVVDVFGSKEGPKSLRPGGEFAGIAPSLGHMAAAYMGDVQGALSPDDKALPRYGTPANLDSGNTAKLLGALGRNPEAFGAIAQAQQAYTTAHIQDVITHRADYGAHSDAAVHNAAHAGGEVAGIITAARTQEIVHDARAQTEAYNHALDENAVWGKSVWLMTGGEVVKGIPIVGPGISEPVKHFIDDLAHNYHIEANFADPATISQMDGASAAAAAAKTAVVNAAQGTGLSDTEIEAMAADTANQVRYAHTNGSTLFTTAIND
ncbi:hypothetical protein [Kitasatospora cathayae]|uniref:Uncharacterized protein n=1 Tax=Kitasatospora cathayae TaxID=3004092 RepID=A0ABY7QAB5_9ACTN|nr:hypothetical protein [Kitasatospora sp. HUAS 3-15]WBP89572.1 hypothetical protein O1G21_29510 [Kitasatospora sp. HUAS 3-15]